MGAYMASLARLAQAPWRRFLPGHGEPVDNPAARLTELAAHRRRREAQILACLRSGPHTPKSLTAAVYHETPAPLLAAAERNVLAHLLDLKARKLVVADPGPAVTARYSGT
jgi:hydroxyacylglutathione hydrolase